MRFFGFVLLSLLGGCATIFDGTSQDIAVATTPAGAHCDFIRQDVVIASIDATPGKVHVQRTKYDLTVSCSKVGFAAATGHLHSGLATDVGLNGAIFFYAPIGVLVDSATGADNHYDPVVTLGLTRLADSSASAKP